MTHLEHVSTFFCAGGNCRVAQCVYCVTLLRVEQENKHCFQCGMLKDLCSCEQSAKADKGKTRVEVRLNNSS